MASALERFNRLSGAFAERLAAVRPFGEPAFVRADWAERAEVLAGALLPRPPLGFLRLAPIEFQMFVGARYLSAELPYVLDRVPDVRLLEEDPVGQPPVTSVRGVTTSSNTVHHLHHLLRFEELTGRPLAGVASVVEWGAGYGNLAKLLLRLHGGSPTLVVIDLPVFSAVQWLYLSSVLGEERVVLHDEPGAAVAAGRVNVVPVRLAGTMALDAELFVSTWALNESTRAAQRFVLDREWLGAEALLLGMHRGDPFAEDVLAAGARAVPLGDWMPGQHYFVR